MKTPAGTSRVLSLIGLLVMLPFPISKAAPNTDGMIWIPGGEFMMGSEDQIARKNEQPPHPVRVSGFWLDETPVTNEQFARFVKATSYVTVAERKPDWEELRKQLPPGTPKPDPSLLVAGSMVFTPSEGPVDLSRMDHFWRWVPGASWHQPEGPGSDLKGRESHPVVQVCWEDAEAYAKWLGKRLPTEAEWEFAAKGGSEARYHWGDEFQPEGKHMANTWTGKFPYQNTREDGFERTAPVKSFPPNGYGLYDMAGNVWNWCSDWYQTDIHASRASEPACSDPTGPTVVARQSQPSRVTKGGSFLCHPEYCASYRPSARRGLSPDTGMSHVGFRCAVNAPMPEKAP
jgi:formylglycine-generating enzyme